MDFLKGATIRLYDRVKTCIDDFNAPVYKETAVEVENILIGPASTEAVTDGLQLYGKHAEYELYIPKADAHEWENRTVEFYGQKWRTFGKVLVWMEALTPGTWNRKVKVERYG